MAVVLIVDDDPTLLDSLGKEFCRTGFTVWKAENAHQGREWLAKNTPDLIILDVMMPGEDGLTFLQSLKKEEQWRSIPVIMLTARDSEADLYQGWKTGADAYLTKPFTKEEVILMAKGILQDNKTLEAG